MKRFSVEAGHFQITDDGIERLLGDLEQRLLAIRRVVDGEPGVAERVTHRRGQRRFVFNHQNRSARGGCRWRLGPPSRRGGR